MVLFSNNTTVSNVIMDFLSLLLTSGNEFNDAIIEHKIKLEIFKLPQMANFVTNTLKTYEIIFVCKLYE